MIEQIEYLRIKFQAKSLCARHEYGRRHGAPTITERIGQLPIRQRPIALRQFYQARKSWQTFAWNLINLCSVSVTSLAAQVNVYRLGNDYALYEVTGYGLDAVAVFAP